MRDERLWRDTCENFLSQASNVSRPQFPQSTHGTPGTMIPLLARKTVAFYDSGFPTEARVIRGRQTNSQIIVSGVPSRRDKKYKGRLIAGYHAMLKQPTVRLAFALNIPLCNQLAVQYNCFCTIQPSHACMQIALFV